MRGNFEQSNVSFASPENIDLNVDSGNYPRDRAPQEYSNREMQEANKVDIAGRELYCEKTDGLIQNEVSFSVTSKADIPLEKSWNLRSDTIGQGRIDYKTAPRAEIEREIQRVQKLLGLADLRQETPFPSKMPTWTSKNSQGLKCQC